MLLPPDQNALSRRVFGHLPDGRAVDVWTLHGRGGLVLEVLTYGGIIRSLVVPRSNLPPVDVVLGFATLEEYRTDTAFVGALAGRIAGRVAHGRLWVEDREYALTRNHRGHHLHGGGILNASLWQAEVVPRPDGAPALSLSLVSPAGDQGYPGEVALRVTYTVEDNNALLLETTAEASEPTPVSLTHHAYFNLGGADTTDVLGHFMQVFSSEYIPADGELILSGRRQPVANTPGDLREPRLLGEVVPRLPLCHGELYWLGTEETLHPVARVFYPGSGLVLETHTSNSCVQTYFAESFDGSRHDKSGKPLQRFCGFCLECQGYPEATRYPHLGDILVRPGSPQRKVTRYQFHST